MLAYHRDVNTGIPDIDQTKNNTIQPIFSFHAIEQCIKKHITTPYKISYTHEEIVELYMFNPSDVDRIVIRTPYDNRFDLVVVYSPTKNKIITLWLNSKYDSHKTLDVSKYT
jgi:hypothetical protein